VSVRAVHRINRLKKQRLSDPVASGGRDADDGWTPWIQRLRVIYWISSKDITKWAMVIARDRRRWQVDVENTFHGRQGLFLVWVRPDQA